MSMKLFLTTPHVEIEDHIYNAQLFWGKTADHAGA